MLKYCTNQDWSFQERLVTLIDQRSNGLTDQRWLQKQASSVDERDWMRELPMIAGHKLAHVLIVGDSETYGYNRNGDGFSRADNRKPDIHGSFVKHGHAFRDHDNKIEKGSKAYGRPVLSHHNDDMGRIELVVALHEKDASDIIHKIATDPANASWSMGCDVAFDVCTVRDCHNRARHPGEYCEHAQRTKLGRVLTDGQLCGLDNPSPFYFDASFVGRPAERTAHSFRLLKAAAAGDEVLGGAELAQAIGLALPEDVAPAGTPLAKWAALTALASMEKQIPVQVTLLRGAAPEDLDDETIEVINKQACNRGLAPVMDDLHSRGVLLRPAAFFRATLGKRAWEETVRPRMAQIRSCLKTAFADAVTERGGDLVDDGRFDGKPDGMALPGAYTSKLAAVQDAASVDAHVVQRRAVKVAVSLDTTFTLTKHAAAPATPDLASRGLATLYSTYGLAFASHPHNARSILAKQAVVLTNHQEHLR